MAVRGNMHMDTRVVVVTEFNSEVRCDLQGCLEVATASEATKMPVRGNMHMDNREIKAAGFKSEGNLDLGVCWRQPMLLRQPEFEL